MKEERCTILLLLFCLCAFACVSPTLMCSFLIKASAVSISLEIYEILSAFSFFQYIFSGTIQSVLWGCCSHCFHWGYRISFGSEGECTACTFSGCHNGFEWKIAVFLWPKVQPLCIQGHGILGPWVLAVSFVNMKYLLLCHFFHYAPSVSFFLCFPPIVFLDSLVWHVLLSLCVCVYI